MASLKQTLGHNIESAFGQFSEAMGLGLIEAWTRGRMHWSIRAAQREALHRSVAVLRAWARAHILPESIPLEDIVARARAYMAAYKVPRAVECVDALPKSGSGKVMWRRLQQRDGV